MGKLSYVLVLLLISVAVSSAQVKFNDDRHKTDIVSGALTPSTCPGDDERWCLKNCTVTNRFYLGYYQLPFTRCSGNSIPSTTQPWCFGNAVLKEQCCAKCLDNTTCGYWQHFMPTVAVLACDGCGLCIIWPPAMGPTCAPEKEVGGVTRRFSNASTIGHPCGEGENDPHFRGAHGTRFEFNGLPDQSFCLLTDRNLHMNMRMRGYYDTRTVGASILKNGKAVRTWIRELGIMWTDRTGQKHSLRLLARDGKKTARGKGFLKEIEYDGHVLPLLKLGEKYTLKGGLTFAFEAYEKAGRGFFDVDSYQLEIEGLLIMGVKLRVAHPLLQTKDDAEAHLNVHFEHIYRTDDIHGIMGQTYRDGRQRRALDYTTLAEVIGRPIAADGPSGAGFLDGQVKDYRTSGVLSPDCLYTAFDGHEMPTISEYKGLPSAPK